jgi:hypothetical protein
MNFSLTGVTAPTRQVEIGVKYKESRLKEVGMLYAKWYEVVIVIFVLLWLFGSLGQSPGY